MKIKEENRDKFISAIQNLIRSMKKELDDSSKLCGGINEKEMLIINYIGQNKNVKMSDVADIIDAPMSTLTNIVDKLVERKYLSREHSAEDRRAIIVMLADNGKNAYKVISSRKKVAAEKLLSQFNEKEQTTFIEHINILASNLGQKK
jgi:DNA-binding MarR family transcriptional regulator